MLNTIYYHNVTGLSPRFSTHFSSGMLKNLKEISLDLNKRRDGKGFEHPKRSFNAGTFWPTFCHRLCIRPLSPLPLTSIEDGDKTRGSLP
jgi:hypothetical protein